MTTVPEVERRQRPLTDFLPLYAVILHNDDHNTMEFVVLALLEGVPELSADDAVGVMLEAHLSGAAVVIVKPLETAEVYRDRLRAHGLGVTVEPA